MLRLFFTHEKGDNRIFQYMLGWQPSDGRLLIDDVAKRYIAFLDPRYYGKSLSPVAAGRTGEKVLLDQKFTVLLEEVLLSQNITKNTILLEQSLPYGVFMVLSQRSKKTFDTDIWVVEEQSRQQSLRLHKTAADRTSLRTVIAKTDQVWEWLEQQALAGTLLGTTEREVRAMLFAHAVSIGLEDEAFATIVAFGKNTAVPHHRASDTLIEAGPLLVDMGYRRQGWCSDMTRCLWVGNAAVDPVYTEILSIVREAHTTARDAVKLGVPFADIVQTARKVIEDAGYGDYFTHALGHGVGLDVHEAPGVSGRSAAIVESGMVFTIEPGIYLPGKFGVRWETIVIVE